MAALGEITFTIGGIDGIHAALTRIERKVDLMSADQAALDQAVTDLVNHTSAIDAAIGLRALPPNKLF